MSGVFWGSVFLTVLDMTVAGSLVICAVLPLRLVLKRAPRAFSYALWLVVLFRLLCPVAPEAAVGVPGGADAAREVDRVLPAYTGADAIPAGGVFGEIVARGEAAARPEQAVAPDAQRHWLQAFSADLAADFGRYVWLAGAGVMLLRAAAQYIRLRRRLIGAAPLRGNIWQADHIDTPFVLGLLRPRIYLPSALEEGERDYVVAHERRHIRRGDPIWRLLAFAALCVHWFNPLVWLAFTLSRRDMELSCDEGVLREMGRDIRADYAESLLRFTTGKRRLVGAPLAFGESDTKERIVHTMKYKKPTLWVSVIAAMLCVGAVTVLAFNAKQEEPPREPPAVVSSGINGGTSGAVNSKADGETGGETADGTDGERLTVIRWWDADLDGDGTPEQIILDKGELERASVTTPWIKSTDGKKLCELHDVGTPHVGWSTFALLEMDGRTYLFEYSPYMSTGLAGYQYWIFSLDADTGELMLEDGKEAVFPVWEPMTDEEIDAVVEFVNAANEYWPHCRLLFSTDQGFARGLMRWDGSAYAGEMPILCGDDDNLRYVETLPWMADDLAEEGALEEGMDLREQLEAYRELSERRHAEYLKTVE